MVELFKVSIVFGLFCPRVNQVLVDALDRFLRRSFDLLCLRVSLFLIFLEQLEHEWMKECLEEEGWGQLCGSCEAIAEDEIEMKRLLI